MRVVFALFAFIISHIYFVLKILSLTSYPTKYFLRDVRSSNLRKPGERLADSIVWSVYVVTTNIPWLNTCLIRSLSTITLLRIFRIESILHIGARKNENGDELEAHMWISDGDETIFCDEVSDLSSYGELESRDNERSG